MVLDGRARTGVTREASGAKDGACSFGGKAVVDYGKPGGAKQVRDLLERIGMSQRAVAKELDISDRMMRYYCAGKQEVPRVVILALERLVDLGRQVTK
jgi:hypothetical protein